MSNAPERPNLESRLAELEHDHRDHCEYCHDMFRMGLESQALIIRINQNNINTNRYNTITCWCVLCISALAFIQSSIALYSIKDHRNNHEPAAISVEAPAATHPNTAP